MDIKKKGSRQGLYKLTRREQRDAEKTCAPLPMGCFNSSDLVLHLLICSLKFEWILDTWEHGHWWQWTGLRFFNQINAVLIIISSPGLIRSIAIGWRKIGPDADPEQSSYSIWDASKSPPGEGNAKTDRSGSNLLPRAHRWHWRHRCAMLREVGFFLFCFGVLFFSKKEKKNLIMPINNLRI